MRFLRASLLIVALLAGADLFAVEPGLRTVNLRGVQIGAATTLVVDGDDLGKEPRLLLPFAATVTLKPGGTDKQATFEITPAGDAVPGYHQMRVTTEGGVSLPVLIAVDRLPQKAFGPIIESLPVALHGVASGSVPVVTTFTGKAGQKVTVEIEAQRLGSKLRPVVHLVGPGRVEVAWSWPNPGLGGDTRLEAKLPADGSYTISLHDSEYAGANPGFFRMRVGQWQRVDRVFPPVVGNGKQTVELLGSEPVARIEVTPPTGAKVVPLTWPSGQWSGPRPFVRVSSHPEVVEQPTSGKGQELPGGTVAVSGKLAAPFEEDRYQLPVKAGQKIRLEVQAERLGSSLDAALIVRNPAGTEVARGEDSPNTLDPILDYTVPADTTSILVGVVDTQGRGGAQGVYRLIVTPQAAGVNQADFQLLTATQRLSVPANGSVVYHVGIVRDGYRGPVELAAEGLPAGVTLEGTRIPEDAEGTLVTLRRGAAPAVAGILSWHGKADNGGQRVVGVKGHPLERLQPWLATEVAVAPTADRGGDFSIDWRDLAPGAGLSPAGKLTLPFKLTRPISPTEKSPVRVTLLTNQLGALATPARDPNTQLRLEKAVELPPGMVDGEAVTLVPSQLTAPTYDVTLKAELLTPDKARVLATAFAPVRRMPLKLPLAVTSEKPRYVVALDPKTPTVVEIKGGIQRLEGATGDVQLTLANLPPGVAAVPVTTLKGDVSTYALKVTLPVTTARGETLLKLSGTIAPDPKQPNVRVRSRELDIPLVVQ